MIDQVFERISRQQKPLRSMSLWDHLAMWLVLSPSELKQRNALFLKTITTYVVRNFQQRRKGGVPVGHLEKFCLRKEVKFNLFSTLAAFVVSVMRKRGVRELELRATSPMVQIFDKAFEKVPKIKN